MQAYKNGVGRFLAALLIYNARLSNSFEPEQYVSLNPNFRYSDAVNEAMSRLRHQFGVVSFASTAWRGCMVGMLCGRNADPVPLLCLSCYRKRRRWRGRPHKKCGAAPVLWI